MKKTFLTSIFLISMIFGDEYPNNIEKHKIDNLIVFAKKYANKVKYVWGGTSLKKGIDCSAFMQKVYAPYIRLPRTTNTQIHAKNIQEIPRTEWIRKGDLIYFNFENKSHKKVDHVGMYIGGNKFIHSSSSLKGVRITKLSEKWRRNIMRIIRLPL